MSRFTLRDLFWLVLVVALSVAWWRDYQKLQSQQAELRFYRVTTFYPYEPKP